ncbi:CRAL-TRIO domain-containing protein [Aspergillus pseudodeflectus]|uniref:CRAL-TRIO domain-containing protein n=1 Tax=Aspergillus pseudodeflectus TaxID=176178 RepID=A0ABR4K3Y9_9EURO
MVGITTDEAAAAATFSKLCAEKGLLKRAGWKDGDIQDGITDQHTLLRFLQANSMNPSLALQQLQQATDFHTKNEALSLYDLIDVEDYEDTRRLYPTWTGRRDNRGRPLLMIDIAALEKEHITHWRATRTIPSGRQDGGNSRYTSNMAQRALVFFDGLTRFVLPLCTAVRDAQSGRRDNDVLKCVVLIEATTVSLKQGWDVRDFAKEISWILATCFPEVIDRIYVCNAPSYFSTLWKMLKGFVEPKTAEKIVVLTTSETYPALNEDIEHPSIPANFGGGFAYETGILPDLDEELCRALQWSVPEGQLPPGPIKWVKTDGGKWKAIATGTIEGVARADEVAVLSLNARNGAQL